MAALIPPEIGNFFQFTDSLIAQRVEQELNAKSAAEREEIRDDFVHLFREHENSLNDAAIDEIKAEATVLLVAGSDTVATALSAVLFYLTHNPQCLERAVAEIRSIFASVDDINGSGIVSREIPSRLYR
jgi:cytochrome P450